MLNHLPRPLWWRYRLRGRWLPARPTAGSAGRRAVGGQTAGLAGRPAGVADAAAVKNQGVVEEGPAVYREQRLEIPLHLVRVVVAAELQPAGEAADVGVDRDPGPAEGIAGHDISRLAADAGQGEQGVEVVGHLAAVAVHQLLGGRDDVLALVRNRPIVLINGSIRLAVAWARRQASG